MDEHNAPSDVFSRYERLQCYIGWTDDDSRRVRAAASTIEPLFDALVDDFYASIQREPETARLITGGDQQIQRLKRTLHRWLAELFSGRYDERYVARRWQVGQRHVEIGLRQIYADGAMARLRSGIQDGLFQNWPGDREELPAISRSLDRLIDLELAIIEDSYTAERLVEQRFTVKRQSEATFRNLVEAAHCLITIIRPDHSIAYFSPFAEQLTGYRSPDVLGKDFRPILLPAAEWEGVSRQLTRILAGGEPAVGYEIAIRCRDGSELAVLWNAQRLDDYEGGPAVLAVGHDVTQQKAAQQQLLQSERLAAIGQMVAGLAHESRNAFQRSQACLEMLALELEDQPEQLDMLGRVQRALDHLHHLYEEVRTYAAPINLDRHSCDLARAWRSSWSHLEVSRQEKNVELVETCAGVDLTCKADEFALGQVFRNILENAIAASQEQGKIEIDARETLIDGDPAVEIHFIDRGTGFSTEAAKRIFEPFYTTKTKGTGLGMAIAHRIVHAHGGKIAVGPPSTAGGEIIVTIRRS